MAKKYIDADRLNAEIEKRKIANQQDATESGAGAFYEDKAILDLIDSLLQEPSCETCTNDKGCVTCKDGELWEGKEVDLEKEIEEYWIVTGWSKHITLGKFKVIARHFYELGQLNAK